MPENKQGILISKKLYERIKRFVELKQSKFKTVEKYVEFMLAEAMKEEEEAEYARSSMKEEKIKERLRELGYL